MARPAAVRRRLTATPVRTFLVSYAAGHPVHARNQRALLRSAAGKGLDVLLAHGRSELPAAFLARHRHILEQRRGAGYWLWKPYLIRECLRRADEGDVVLYLDSSVLVRRPLQPLLEQAAQSHLLLLENVHANATHVKRDCFVLTGTDVPACHRATHLDASFLAVRNTDANRRFVNAWLEYCADDRILTDKPNECGQPDLAGFLAHRHDQAVLSVLLWRERHRLAHLLHAAGALGDYLQHHRRRSAWVPIPVWHHTPTRVRAAVETGWRELRGRVSLLRRALGR